MFGSFRGILAYIHGAGREMRVASSGHTSRDAACAWNTAHHTLIEALAERQVGIFANVRAMGTGRKGMQAAERDRALARKRARPGNVVSTKIASWHAPNEDYESETFPHCAAECTFTAPTMCKRTSALVICWQPSKPRSHTLHHADSEQGLQFLKTTLKSTTCSDSNCPVTGVNLPAGSSGDGSTG